MKSIIWAIVSCAMLATDSARCVAAVSAPFTEDFATDTAKWKNLVNAGLTWNSIGGPDGGSYANASQVFQRQVLTMGLTLFRAHDAFDSSNDAFVGNWLTTGVEKVSIDVRQNTSQPLSLFVRIAKGANFPGVTVQSPTVVQPDTWTKVDFDLNPANPLVIPEGGPGTYQAVLGRVGNLQSAWAGCLVSPAIRRPTSLIWIRFRSVFRNLPALFCWCSGRSVVGCFGDAANVEQGWV